MLILVGDTDFIHIRNAAEAMRLLPQGQLAVLPSTTHGVRPALMAEYPRKRVKAIREEKIYEREYSSSRSRAREALSTTLSALHYPVITDDPERWEVRFLWGSEEKAAGRTVAPLYRRIEPDGVRAVVLRTRPGHVKIMIESASVQRVIASISNVVPLLGVPSRSITMLERKVIREFLNQIQLVLGGHGVSKDPAAMLDNLMSRTTRGRSRS